MKTITKRVALAALGVLLIPVCACVIYISGGENGVDGSGTLLTQDEVAMMTAFSIDDEAIALADSSDSSSSLRSEALRAFELVNSKRAAAGLNPLVWDANLEGPASVRAQECSISFSHTRPNGSKWNSVNSKIMHGENLAYGFYDASSALNAWMNSPTHRENILYPSFKRVAIAIYAADDGTYYWSQEFGY